MNKTYTTEEIVRRLNAIKSSVIHFFKVRFYAKPFDIWNECQDDNRKKDTWLSADYISYDGKLYYGHPFGIFFESPQNIWWLKRNSYTTQTDNQNDF